MREFTVFGPTSETCEVNFGVTRRKPPVLTQISRLPGRIDVTIDDAKAHTRPWSTAIRLIAVPDTEMLDAQCLENEKDVPHLLNAKPEGAR